MMILLNIGSRFVEIKLSDSMESFIKYNIAREVLIFTMAWMGTRDIIVALILTASFMILSEFLLNNKILNIYNASLTRVCLYERKREAGSD